MRVATQARCGAERPEYRLTCPWEGRCRAGADLVHGGIGFTWEHDLHFFLKRAKVDGTLFGSARDHRERVAALSGLGAAEPAAAGA